MILATAAGTQWHIEDGAHKLSLRARLPGARLYDHVAESVRRAEAAGLSIADRLAIALPGSWCVNSPAPSTVLRRWVLSPQRDVWIALLELLEAARDGLDEDSEQALFRGVAALGGEPYAVEAISKVAALVVPDVVPLMPPAAMAFVLGAGVRADERGFVAMVRWFLAAAAAVAGELSSLAAGHREAALLPAQVLDRLLWFDSEGFRHFAKAAEA
jgi:hypothetical protein